MRDQEVSEKELTDAKSYLTGIFPIRLETQEGLVEQLLQIRMHGLPPDYLETYRDRIMKVTREDVRRVANQYVTPDSAAVVLVGDAAEVRAQAAEYADRVEDFDASAGRAAANRV